MGEVARVCAWQFIRCCDARDGFLRAYRALGGKGYRVEARSPTGGF